MKKNFRIFPHRYLIAVAKDIFASYGAPESEAEIVSEILVSANLMGLDSHGIIRVPQYIQAVMEGKILPGAPVTILNETAGTAIVDAGWNFGQVGGTQAVRTAIEMARSNRIASVLVRRCNHLGRLGAYPEMAAEENFISLAMCSSLGDGHWVPPWGGKEGRLATNPISFAVPTEGEPILVDISTSVVSEGKIRLKRNRGESLPEDWVLNADGFPGNETDDFYGPPMGVILPLGGKAGYKGYFLSLMVEILSRVLTGEKYPQGEKGAAGNGLWIMVMDINAFLPHDEFQKELKELIAYLKSSSLANGFNEITVPGELDFGIKRKRIAEGVPLEDRTWEEIEKIAKERKCKSLNNFSAMKRC